MSCDTVANAPSAACCLLAACQSGMNVSVHQRICSLSKDVSTHSGKQTGLLTSQMLKVQMECMSMAMACTPSALSASGLCSCRMCLQPFSCKATRGSSALSPSNVFVTSWAVPVTCRQGDRCIMWTKQPKTMAFLMCNNTCKHIAHAWHARASFLHPHQALDLLPPVSNTSQICLCGRASHSFTYITSRLVSTHIIACLGLATHVHTHTLARFWPQ